MGPVALALGLLVAGPGLAQHAGVAVGSLASRLALSGRLEAHGESGCSRSFASTDVLADFELAVDARGHASLHVIETMHHVFGPSFGEFRAGARDFSYTTDLVDGRWTGTATRDPAGTTLTIHFTTRESAVGRIEQIVAFEDVTMPAPTTEAVDVTIECTKVERDVHPADAAPDVTSEPSERVSLLSCVFPQGLDPLTSMLTTYAEREIVLGARGGVRNVHREDLWSTPSSVLRFVAD